MSDQLFSSFTPPTAIPDPNFRREISYVCPFLVSIALLRYEASMTSDSGSHDKTAGGANHFPGDPGRFG